MRYDITMDYLNDEDVRKITKWVQNNPYGFTSHTVDLNLYSDLAHSGTQIKFIQITGIIDLKGFSAAMEGQ